MREGWEEIEHCSGRHNYFKKRYGYFTFYYHPIDNKLGIVLDYIMIDVKDINSIENNVQRIINSFLKKLQKIH